MAESVYSIEDASEQSGVPIETLEKWVEDGLIPDYRGGDWTAAAIAHARIVRRLHDRGHTFERIKKESDDGRLSFAFVEDLFRSPDAKYNLKEAAEQAGIEKELLEKIMRAAGFNREMTATFNEADLDLFRGLGVVVSSGFPLDPLVQLTRVYGQSIAQIAESEVRLFHMFVHEPLIEAGAKGEDMSAGMEELLSGLLPVTVRMLDYLHRRFLQQFIEQNIVAMLEANLQDRDPGRLPVAIAFADLAGYTKLTEEEGEQSAFVAVEKFVDSVVQSLPDSARITKTIGDELMVIGTEPKALMEWAVKYQQEHDEPPYPCIGIHYGETLYRDGDYFGREVNQASRVTARAAGGEVLATKQIVDACRGVAAFERIGEVQLKGFTEPTELFLATSEDSGS